MRSPVTQVDEAVLRSGMLPTGSRCVVAVSGGRDSMVLLAILHALRASRDWQLTVAHFHHGLRGAEADADLALVEEAGTALGLRVVAGIGDVQAARTSGESLEDAARRLRHRFLADTARQVGAVNIATGHHAGDQTELFLLRLLRGAGSHGLGGMNPVDPSPADPSLRLVRPLLGFEPVWIAEAARQLEVRWREDRSNADSEFRRNRVRHELIPLLESRFQPALVRTLERTRLVLRDEALAIEAWADRWLAGERSGTFSELPNAVQRDIVRLQLERAGIRWGCERIEALRERAEVPVQIDPERRVQREVDGRLRWVDARVEPGPFLEAESVVELAGSGGPVRFGGGVLEWATVDGAPGVGMDAGTEDHAGPASRGVAGDERFDATTVGGRIRLRHWRAGDRFQPIGLGAEARLQDLFTNARVPKEERRSRVVAETEDGRLFWVEGLRIGELAKCTSATTSVLEWRWRR